mmetsp:Transcript_101270/g.326834  ORF Transcript_101270/g.326834 Transcript_101270/m.326834 type:complete len:267 (+) Transcript_101270:515-1315(+)
MQARRHVESAREVGVGYLGEFALGGDHGCLPTDVHWHRAALLGLVCVLEEQEAMLGKQGLGGQFVCLHSQRLRGRSEQLLLRWHVCGWQSPPEQEKGVLVKDVWQARIHAFEVGRRLEQTLLHWVEHDIPEGHCCACKGRHPCGLPHTLPLMTGEHLVCVTAHGEERIKEVDEKVTPAFEPHSGEEYCEQCCQRPEVPSVEVRKADHKRDGCYCIQDNAREKLCRFRRQRRITDLGRGASTSGYGRYEGHRCNEVSEVLPEVRMAR